ncbi:MAG: hypothetical protein L6R42_000453 [Xanthoria sp. 1 TBL-2021]|nr:MAG: hypothetical protein L6R42_000453 [Xanthoria sp. 1 TBL-2021]
MQPNIAYLILGALAAMTSASPQAISQESVTAATTESALPPQSTASVVEDGAGAARADLSVKFCTDANFRGRCDTYAVTKGVCWEEENPPMMEKGVEKR